MLSVLQDFPELSHHTLLKSNWQGLQNLVTWSYLATREDGAYKKVGTCREAGTYNILAIEWFQSGYGMTLLSSYDYVMERSL